MQKEYMNLITTSDNRQFQKPDTLTAATAVTAGYVTNSLVKRMGVSISTPFRLKMVELNTKNDTVKLNQELSRALSDAKVDKCGVEIFNHSTTPYFNQKKYAQEAVKNLKLNLNGKPLFEKLRIIGSEVRVMFKNLSSARYINGDAACYSSKSNKIFIRVSNRGLSGFHEIGHSVNYHLSPFWKTIQKMRRPMMMVSSTLPMIALFKRKKVEGEEPQNFVDKSTTFIKNNVGKLTALAFVPTILEELKATQRGNKLAKQICSPEVYKKVVKSNACGAATYISASVFWGLAAYAMNKVRDFIAEPKEILNTNL